MSHNYSLPDADLKPPRVHTLGLSITAGAMLSMIAVIVTISNATAPDVPAEHLKSTREIDQTRAAQEPTPSPSPSPSQNNKK